MKELVINRTYVYSFLAGGMTLEMKGTCTAEELHDAENMLEIAIRQIRREREILTKIGPSGEQVGP